MKSLSRTFDKLVSRTLDRHVRLAITGLSRAGKTAFITSLVNQLLHSGTHDALPLFAPSREGRLVGARREQQVDLSMPSFAYDEAMGALNSQPPRWPEPTRDVSEIRLALRYRVKGSAMSMLQETAMLYIDIVDYPGEWLLDLPMLNLDFASWSKLQCEKLTGCRAEAAKVWLAAMESVDLNATADDGEIARISELYTDYLHRCKDECGLHYVQPGRFVLPGELAGAPVVQFFPVTGDMPEKPAEGSYYARLKQRYDYYCQHVVKKFYREYFSSFDRQIVLVDALQPLNQGMEVFGDMRQALSELIESFHYGRNSLLKRLFSPRIDKLLFAATKADHITPDQHANLVAMLNQLIYGARQKVTFDGIAIECISIASIEATEAGYVAHDGKQVPALRGTNLDGQALTVYPGDVPAKLPDAEYWQKQGFDFQAFRPKAVSMDDPLPHIRMDKALQFLLGDKLK